MLQSPRNGFLYLFQNEREGPLLELFVLTGSAPYPIEDERIFLEFCRQGLEDYCRMAADPERLIHLAAQPTHVAPSALGILANLSPNNLPEYRKRVLHVAPHRGANLLAVQYRATLERINDPADQMAAGALPLLYNQTGVLIADGTSQMLHHAGYGYEAPETMIDLGDEQLGDTFISSFELLAHSTNVPLTNVKPIYLAQDLPWKLRLIETTPELLPAHHSHSYSLPWSPRQKKKMKTLIEDLSTMPAGVALTASFELIAPPGMALAQPMDTLLAKLNNVENIFWFSDLQIHPDEARANLIHVRLRKNVWQRKTQFWNTSTRELAHWRNVARSQLPEAQLKAQKLATAIEREFLSPIEFTPPQLPPDAS